MNKLAEKNPEKISARGKRYYAKHKKRIIERQKKYYEDNKETIRSYQAQLRRDKPENTLFRHAKERAARRGILFSITKKDIFVPAACPLLEIPIFVGNNKLCDNSPTIDRIVPNLGYVKNNIRVISYKANRIKNNATFEEFQMVYNNWKSERKIHNERT